MPMYIHVWGKDVTLTLLDFFGKGTTVREIFRAANLCHLENLIIVIMLPVVPSQFVANRQQPANVLQKFNSDLQN